MSETLRELYQQLLSIKFADGRTVFERVNASDLCVAGHHKGWKYDSEDNKLMIYGQAVNGWQNQDHADIESLVEEILNRTDDSREMRMMADCRGWHGDVDGKKASYYYKRSKFWKLNYQVITNITDGSFNKFYVPYTSEDDYPQQLDNAWSQEVVWSNLYKIAFSRGGNPDSQIIDAINDISRKIVLEEIAELRPGRVLFNTGENMFVDMFLNSDWAGKENLVLQKESSERDIRYIGHYEYEPGHICKIVVCRRPDERAAHYKNTDIINEAKEILKYL